MTSNEKIVGEFGSWEEVVKVLAEIDLPCLIVPVLSIHTEQMVNYATELKDAINDGLVASPIGKIQIRSVITDE